MAWFSGLFSHFDIDEPSRQWIGEHLRWLGEQCGEDRLIDDPIVEPTDVFFPDPYDGSAEAITALFAKVCGYMNVDPACVELSLFRNRDRGIHLVGDDGVSLGIAGGTYHATAERFVIRLDEAKLHDPARAVATLSHELAYVRLMGENRVDGNRYDNELLTDLCAIYLGFGIFRANAPAYAPPGRHTWPGTQVQRTEYMSLPMIAYTLAVIAERRSESKPAWARHLRGAARAEFRAARTYRASCAG